MMKILYREGKQQMVQLLRHWV